MALIDTYDGATGAVAPAGRSRGRIRSEQHPQARGGTQASGDRSSGVGGRKARGMKGAAGGEASISTGFKGNNVTAVADQPKRYKFNQIKNPPGDRGLMSNYRRR